MKKILITLFTLVLIGCSGSESRSTSYNNGAKLNMEAINKGVSTLLTPTETNELIKGGEGQFVVINTPSHGLLGDGIASLFSDLRGIDSGTKQALEIMQNNPNTIIVSENSDSLIKAIKYLGESEEGRKILTKGRYVFVKSALTNYSFVSKSEVEELAKKYKFKYYYQD